MSQTSKLPIISLSAIGGTVRSSENGKHMYLDVTFKCGFTDDKEGICGSAIGIGNDAMYSVAQLAQTAYITICKSLAGQQDPKPSR